MSIRSLISAKDNRFCRPDAWYGQRRLGYFLLKDGSEECPKGAGTPAMESASTILIWAEAGEPNDRAPSACASAQAPIPAGGSGFTGGILVTANDPLGDNQRLPGNPPACCRRYHLRYRRGRGADEKRQPGARHNRPCLDGKSPTQRPLRHRRTRTPDYTDPSPSYCLCPAKRQYSPPLADGCTDWRCLRSLAIA